MSRLMGADQDGWSESNLPEEPLLGCIAPGDRVLDGHWGRVRGVCLGKGWLTVLLQLVRNEAKVNALPLNPPSPSIETLEKASKKVL